MNFSVLINNYNYGRYLRECVESTLNQSYPAHEIIVVDDGSNDDSLDILNQHFGSNPRVKIIPQFNQGQTAAVATGIEAATGDVVCFLDSDDRYKPEYLATLRTHYADFPKTDLTFCRYESFGENAFLFYNEGIWLKPQKDYDYGYTALLAYFGNFDWIGNLTSTISLRRRLARNLDLREVVRQLHVPNQADYSILWGASLLGCRKYYLHRVLIDYRSHDSNRYRTLTSTQDGRYGQDFNDAIRKEYFKRRSCISEEMFGLLEAEAQAIPDPTPGHLEKYRALLNTRKEIAGTKSKKAPLENISWSRKLERKIRSVRKQLLRKKT